MALVEFPDGLWIDAATVRRVRPVVWDKSNPRVLVDVTTAFEAIIVEFDSTDAALVWSRDFAEQVNRVLKTKQ